MSVPSLPRRWGVILTLAGLSLILTLVTGVGAEQCGGNCRCGYGTRCDVNTTQCVCLSDNGELKKREDNPFSVFYCLGEGVTECGEKLCGYRAVCGANRAECQCSSRDVKTELKGRSPSLWYCLERCSSSNKSCPMNTTCTEIKRNFRRCTCSAGATLSSTGQCLGMYTTREMTSSAHLITERTSPSQGDTTERPKPTSEVNHRVAEDPSKTKGDDSKTLIIGVAAGVGGVLIVAVVVVVVAVLARRRKSKRANNNGPAELTQHPPQHPSTPRHHTYHSVVDPPMLGPSSTDNPAGPTVIVRTEVSIISPTSRPGVYEDVDIDFPVVYSTAKVSGESNESKANQAQQANGIMPPSQHADTVEPKDVNGLYSNHTIPLNKVQQRHKNSQESSESMQNQYNTLYALRPANDNTVGAMEGNHQSARAIPKGDAEYDEIKLQKL